MSDSTEAARAQANPDPLTPFVQGDRPTSTLPDLSLVIPTFRQALAITEQVREILRALDRLSISFEVLVVVDGDDDGTASRLGALEHEGLRVAVLDRNVGKGNAVSRGLLAVGGRTRGFLDGGGDIPPHCLLLAYKDHQRSGADIMVGSKLHPGSTVDYPWTRKVYSWGYRQLTRLLFGLDVRDTQVGLKIYSATVVDQVFPHVRARGFAFDVEALALARRLGFRYVEESPIVIRGRYATTIGVQTVLSMFLETLAVWRRVRRFGPGKDGSYGSRLD